MSAISTVYVLGSISTGHWYAGSWPWIYLAYRVSSVVKTKPSFEYHTL